MFRTRTAIFVLALSSCLFQGLSSMFIDMYRTNMHDRELDKNIGKPVFSYMHTLNGARVDQWYYTTDLSRVLLVGEPKFFQSVDPMPIIGGISLLGPLFDNRFEDFVSNVGKYSQQDLQEAIEDALILGSYSTKAYSASKLLENLLKVLEIKVNYIKDQVEHDYTYDQISLSSMKKSAAWFAGLLACVIVADKCTQSKEIKNKVSHVKFIQSIATLGLIPATYKTIKSCCKLLIIDPNALNKYFKEYEELLAFVQKLKFQFDNDGFIVFELANGNTATLLKDTTSVVFKNDTLSFG